ncbi:hypothetical protein F4820DRAFT_386742 [Hypoxylon rubiginosum]|uniref:Uncharacterized protein n=1 Tax=Hypoxylon rubiginosum TaxID=110542 RepID=A0ACB9YVW6_9PEZI|nr:hypothetical protein F4820DRAFT_386742 [Hypoxylon rubiginosum]
MSIYPVMSWIMWLGVHTVADSPDRSQRPNLEVSPFLLATGLTMETMPTLIILIYKVLYFHRNRKQSLQQTFATQEACQAKYQINDNQTLNRALRRVIRNDFLAQLPEVPWDGLTRVYPYDPEGLN